MVGQKHPDCENAQVRVAALGCGAWGKNHVRNLHSLGVLTAVCDTSEVGRTIATGLAPGVRVFSALEALIAERLADAVVISTPTETHFEIGMKAIEAGLDVLIEKPIALSDHDGRMLVRRAEGAGRILMVGHVLEYHPAIVRLYQMIDRGELGTLRYIYSNRLNLGKIRREENILWSFAPHDIAVILRLVGEMPFEVVATGGGYVQANNADVTVTQLLFDNGVRAHIFVSWLHPFKEQRLVVIGSKKMAVFDDVGKELVVFDQRVEWRDGQPLPVVAQAAQKVSYSADEPLRLELEAFVNAIKTRERPRTDGASALAVLEVLCAAQRSLVTQGHPVQLLMDRPVRHDERTPSTETPRAVF